MDKNNEKISFTIDQPAAQDYLDISNYINGITQYIKHCDTPMTLSVQGEWGSGKSSIMKMVRNEIQNAEADPNKPKVLNVWIDTWQFSQFSFGDELPLIILDRLTDGIEREYRKNYSKNDGKNNDYPALKKIKRFIKFLAVNVLRDKTGVDVDEFMKMEEKETSNESDVFEMINTLKKDFNEFVADKEEIERVIIYIDDLDRLVPSKAVEILEVLKIFLDVEKCVFILAIDYDVVTRGVADKYGFKLDNESDRKKARSFFDKIIQVVFSVPSSKYDLSTYIQNFMFKSLGSTFSQDVIQKEFMKYYEIIGLTVGSNPRAVKRIFNSFELLNYTWTDDEEVDKNTKFYYTFIQLCMQNALPNLYKYLEKKFVNIVNNKPKALEYKKMFEDIKEDLDNKHNLSSKELNFLIYLLDIITKPKEKACFAQLFSTTSLTSTSSSSTKETVITYSTLKELYDASSPHIYNYDILEDVHKAVLNTQNEILPIYKSRSNQWLTAYNYRGAAVAEIYLYPNSFTIELKVGIVSDNKEIIRISEKYNRKLSKNNVLSLNLYNDSLSINELLKDIISTLSIVIYHRCKNN